MKIRSFVVALCVGSVFQTAGAAGGGAGGGIADVVRADAAGSRRGKVDRVDTQRSPEIRATDESGGKPFDAMIANALPPSQTCDFSGFANGDMIETAYSGGASSSGVVRNNLGVAFAGTRALNTWNGSGSPDPGVAYAPNGVLLAQNISGSEWNGVAFSYCSRVGLTVETFASTNGTGSPLETFSVAANISAAPFNAWITRSITLARPARSVRISGVGNMWGIDSLNLTSALTCPLWGDGLSCQSAYARGVGTWTINTADAVTSAPCSCSAKYLTFRATANGTVTATTCGYRTYDTWLSAYDTCGGSCLASNDDYCSLGSRIEFPVVAGRQYWVALGGYRCSRGVADVTLSGPIAPAMASGQDCNSDGRDDACQIASGEVSDCNRNGIPDSCDLAQVAFSASANGTLVTDGGTAYHTFTNVPPATADVAMRFEVNADINGGADGIEFVLFTAGGANQISVQITGAQCAAEVRNVLVPAAAFNAARTSSGELMFAIRTGPNTNNFCANTWKIDMAFSYGETDCDRNGVIDSCELAAHDCDANGIHDACDLANGIPTSASRNGTLATNGGTVTTLFAGLRRSMGSVDMRFEVNADTGNGGSSEFVLFTANGPISVNISGPDCSTQVRTISVPAATFNAALDGQGNLQFAIRTGPNTDSFCANTWRIDMSYQGQIPDCNSNGVPDSCELANGTAVDQNGNGIPDSCDPYPTLTLTANSASCNPIQGVVQVDARLSGVLNLVVAGQLVLDWDPTKLELVGSNAGDAPYVSNFIINNASGQAVVLVSAAPGGTGTVAPSAIVARLQFRAIGGNCDTVSNTVTFGNWAGVLSTEFTDGAGTSIVPTLVGSSGFVVDDGPPVLVNVPANVSVQAFAGENGFAFVSLVPPSATDGCAPTVSASAVRSDGRALGDAWPSGTTVVTWSATDPCGNTSTATTAVTVDPTNTLNLALSANASGGGGVVRSLSFAVRGASGSQVRTALVTFDAWGSASASLSDLAVDDYHCVLVEEPTRSLRRRMPVTDGGVVWVAGPSDLVLGDIINDEVIDVLDWGAYIVRNVNADLNGDGVINSQDGNIILANFGRAGDAACGAYARERAAVTAVSVSDLVAMGLPELAGADLNGDGWVDGVDMDLAGD